MVRYSARPSGAVAGGQGRPPHHGVGAHKGRPEAGHESGAVGPVAEHLLPGGVAVAPRRVRLRGVPLQLVADEQRDRHAQGPAAVERVPELLLGAQPWVEEDGVAVLQPPVPQHQLGQAQVRVGDLRRVGGDLGEGEGGPGPAHRRPHRAHAERLAQAAGGVVGEGAGGEALVGARPGVPVPGVGQEHEVAALPGLPGGDVGVVHPAQVDRLGGAVGALHQQGGAVVAGVAGEEGHPGAGAAVVQPLHVVRPAVAVLDVALQPGLQIVGVVRAHGDVPQGPELAPPQLQARAVHPVHRPQAQRAAGRPPGGSRPACRCGRAPAGGFPPSPGPGPARSRSAPPPGPRTWPGRGRSGAARRPLR